MRDYVFVIVILFCFYIENCVCLKSAGDMFGLKVYFTTYQTLPNHLKVFNRCVFPWKCMFTLYFKAVVFGDIEQNSCLKLLNNGNGNLADIWIMLSRKEKIGGISTLSTFSWQRLIEYWCKKDCFKKYI